ncbi:MAG TPA: STN domain-containing protein [Planctomycetota bacterium]|nr:STN domain-containing protein [Planctomycetota bacterium]
MSLMFVLLVQAQEPTLEDRIAAFAKGDAAAREALLKHGVGAILALHKARDKAPEKIDALVFEIKKAAAYPKDTKAPDSLDVKCKLQMSNQSPADVIAYLREFTGANLICDRFDPADLKAAKVDLAIDDVPMRQALDQLCRVTGLDYGFFHNVIVVGKPERLWPAGKAAAAFGPPSIERQHRTPDDDKTLENLRKLKINLDFQNATVKSMSEYLKEFAGVAFEVEDPEGKPIPVFRVKEVSMIDALSLAVQICSLDYMFKDGKVVVATREAIQKAITKGSK